MESIGAFLNSQPFIALFLVISIGYAVGKVSVAGLSLGAGAVLFVGLGVGAIAPEAVPPGLVFSIGIAVFVYCLGIQHGKAFFQGLASSFGVKANLLGAIAVVVSCAIAAAVGNFMGVGMDFTVGMFAGSTTSTPSMQAAMAVTGNTNPAISYAITYPIGVIGPILCAYLFNKLLKPDVEYPAPARVVVAEARAGDRGVDGLTISELLQRVSGDLEVLQIRRDGRNMALDPLMTLQPDDLIGVAGLPDTIAQFNFGATEEVRGDRRDMDYVRCFVSKGQFVGTHVGDVELPAGYAAKIMHVRRGDVDLLPSSELVLEFGDQVGVLVEPGGREAITGFFGDSVMAQAEFSFVSLALGLALGALVGMIPIPIPGVGSISLGMAGGPLVAGLVFGYFGRVGPFNFKLPAAASGVLSTFGLSLLLAAIGMSAGGPFVENVGSGLPYLVGAIAVVLGNTLTVLLVGLYVLRMRFDDLLGIVAAVTSPANLAYANELTPTGRPAVVYGMVVPGVGVIVKVAAVQVMLAASGLPPG